MSLKVVVDWDLCQDHGQCAFAAPEVFEIGDDGRMHVLIEEPDESLRSKVEEHKFVFQGETIPVTISYGAALMRDEDRGATDLIGRVVLVDDHLLLNAAERHEEQHETADDARPPERGDVEVQSHRAVVEDHAEGNGAQQRQPDAEQHLRQRLHLAQLGVERDAQRLADPVVLRIGALAGVEIESLRFAFDVAAAGSGVTGDLLAHCIDSTFSDGARLGSAVPSVVPPLGQAPQRAVHPAELTQVDAFAVTVPLGPDEAEPFLDGVRRPAGLWTPGYIG